MARIKIDYGIDLGTTNSAIARMENGESVIKQTKIGMQGKRQRLFILQKYPISPKSQKEIPTK